MMKRNERKPVPIYNALLSLVYRLTVDNHFFSFFYKIIEEIHSDKNVKYII